MIRLLALRPNEIQVITRFNLNDFAEGVSDIAALQRVLGVGGRVRGVKNLHSKLYLSGNTRAIVTSANLTAAALDRNAEFLPSEAVEHPGRPGLELVRSTTEDFGCNFRRR